MEEFVTKAEALEGLQRSSGQLLARFQQNLEMLRRPSLEEASPVVKEILERNKSSRVSRYIQAGCRHLRSDKYSITALSNAMKALEKHTKDVHARLEDLGQLVDAATERLMNDLAMDTENLRSSPENGDDSKPLNEMSTVTTMALVLSMYEQEYEMQARIVEDLSLDTRSGALDSYCTLWGLRPFVDEQALATLRSLKNKAVRDAATVTPKDRS